MLLPNLFNIMKILSIIFIFTITTNGQFLKVDYELERHRTLGNDFSQEFKDKVKENDKKTEKYILYYADGNSFFKSLPAPIVRHENAPVTML